VSITGTPVDLDPIMDLARKHNLWVLEDCAQSPGATYKGRKVGTIGHVGAFSTIAGKITSTGEGGFVITDDDDLYEKISWTRKRLGFQLPMRPRSTEPGSARFRQAGNAHWRSTRQWSFSS
jgi:dTDP-4-amino-4,6-dideoxygalactose transaminase